MVPGQVEVILSSISRYLPREGGQATVKVQLSCLDPPGEGEKWGEKGEESGRELGRESGRVRKRVE